MSYGHLSDCIVTGTQSNSVAQIQRKSRQILSSECFRNPERNFLCYGARARPMRGRLQQKKKSHTAGLQLEVHCMSARDRGCC